MARQVEYKCQHGIDLNFGHAEDAPDDFDCYACYWMDLTTHDKYSWDKQELTELLTYMNKKIVQDNIRNHAAKKFLEDQLQSLDRVEEEDVEGCDDES